MHAFEYLVGLVSILIGLALADIALSTHRLLRSDGPVRWHWHPIAAAVLIVLLVLDLWWGLRQLERTGVTMTVGLFLPLLAALFVFFLLAAAALPDKVSPGGTDLLAYYADNSRYFWRLFAIYILLTSAHVLAVSLAAPSWSPDTPHRLAQNLIPNVAVAGLVASLSISRRGWWHSVVICVLMAALLISHVARPLD
jgi:hypothetical protein